MPQPVIASHADVTQHSIQIVWLVCHDDSTDRILWLPVRRLAHLGETTAAWEFGNVVFDGVPGLRYTVLA